MRLYEEALQLQEEITQIRRTIHRHPEIGRKEFRTSKLIREKLAELGVDEIQSPVPTAVIGLIHGGKGPADVWHCVQILTRCRSQRRPDCRTAARNRA